MIKRYKRAEVNAVDDISFDVAPGEFFVLLGPNGAGKTTTISILTTTLAPTAGQVLIAGHNVATESGAVRQCVGIIFQNPSLDVNLTAEENVRLHAILYGLYPFAPNFALMPRAYQAQIHTLAGVLGIDQEIFKPIKTFSGGMKRKLEIIRSLIHRPQVLFLDEPTSGLDPASRRSLWEYLGQVRAEYQTTIFLTTHYLEEAEQADRICILNAGKVVINDTPAQATALNTATQADGMICPQDQDYFRVQVPGGHGVRASLINYDSGRGLLRLCVFASDGTTQLGCSEDPVPVVDVPASSVSGSALVRVLGSNPRSANGYTVKVELP